MFPTFRRLWMPRPVEPRLSVPRLSAPGVISPLMTIWVALTSTGCCAGGEDYLNLLVGGTLPTWGGVTETSARSLVADFPDDKSLGGDAFEVYDADGRRVSIPVAEERIDNNTRHGCGVSTVMTYDLSNLTSDAYVVVHRRSSGTGDPVNCLEQCPWTEFEGEEALTSELVLLPSEPSSGP